MRNDLCDIVFFTGLRATTAVVMRVRRLLMARKLPASLYRPLRRRWVGVRERIAYYNPKIEGYEKEVAQFCNIPKDKVFIDVGAHVGVYSLRLAKRGITVHAFEPSPDIYKLLEKNTVGCENVNIYCLAVSDKNSEVEFLLLEDSELTVNRFLTTTGTYKQSKHSVKVPAVTIDSMGLENVGLIKIDTEGHEVPVLRGGLKTLRQQRPVLIVELHDPIWKNDIEITAILHSVGYKQLQRVWRGHHRKYFIVAN